MIGIFAGAVVVIGMLSSQAFDKIPLLHAQAPTQSKPPFIVARVIVLAMFILLGIKATRGFHPATGTPALRAS